MRFDSLQPNRDWERGANNELGRGTSGKRVKVPLRQSFIPERTLPHPNPILVPNILLPAGSHRKSLGSWAVGDYSHRRRPGSLAGLLVCWLAKPKKRKR